MQAEHLTRQINQMSAHEIRNVEIQQFGRDLDQLRAKFNPLFAASKQYESTLDEINYAHRIGAITAQEQSAAVMRLDAQYEQAARSANALTAANRSMRGSFHTTNLLFQAQDIAMMTAMGQSPMMLAMQQGMQVGGIFHQIGNGRQIVQALGGAIMGLLNPLNLATIAVIALGAAGVQALMSMSTQMGPTRRSFQEHSEWLSNLLKGYDDLQSAVDSYLSKANTLPAPLGRIEIAGGIDADILRLQELERALNNFRIRADAFIPLGSINEDLATLRQFKSELDAGALTAEQFSEKMLLIALNPAVHGDVQRAARGMLELSREAAEIEVRIDGARIALQGLSDEALVAATRMANLRATFDLLGSGEQTHGGLQRILDGQTEALESLQGMIPDVRTAQQRAAEELAIALRHPSEQFRAEAQAAYDLFVRNSQIMESRSASASARNQWGSSIDSFEQRIAAQRLEITLLGQSTFEIERQKAAFDLLNQAKQAGVQINEPLINQINSMSAEYASAVVEMERLAQAQTTHAEQVLFYRGTFAGLFSDMKSGLRDGMNAWEAMGNTAANALDKIADRALSMAANGIFDMIFGAVMGGLGGNSLGGGWGVAGGFGRPGIFGIPGMAEGGTVTRPGLSWVGERGPELLNLPRGAQVIPNGPSLAMAANPNGGDIVINNVINVPTGTSADVAPAIAREVTKELRRQLPDAIERHNRNPLRRVG